MNEILYIKLYANCILVRGSTRSVICDLQRSLYVPVPHSLSDMFGRNGLLDPIEFEANLDYDCKRT